MLSTLISMSLLSLIVVLLLPSDLPCPLLSSSRGSTLPSVVLFFGRGLLFVLLCAGLVVFACVGVWPTIILFMSLVGFRRSSSLAVKFIVLYSGPFAFVAFPSLFMFVLFVVTPGPHLILFFPVVTSCQACCPS